MEIATRRQPTRAKITESGSAPPAKLAPITMVMATAAAGAMWVIDWKRTSRSPIAPRASWFPGGRDPGEAVRDDESITTLPFRGIPGLCASGGLWGQAGDGVPGPRAIAWNCDGSMGRAVRPRLWLLPMGHGQAARLGPAGPPAGRRASASGGRAAPSRDGPRAADGLLARPGPGWRRPVGRARGRTAPPAPPRRRPTRRSCRRVSSDHGPPVRLDGPTPRTPGSAPWRPALRSRTVGEAR